MSLILTLLFGCHGNGQSDGAPPDGPGETPPDEQTVTPGGNLPFEPAPATMYRLTENEWRNSVQDLIGIWYARSLPVDYALYNYDRVGGSELTIGPLDLEMYETAAWVVAELAIPSADTADVLLGCASDDPGCVRGWLAATGERAWRRAPTTEELDALMALHASVATDLDGTLALQAVLASVLLAPDFLFRVEVGEPDPAHPEWRRLTSVEMAGRLASFLTASVPDAELMRAANAGELLTTAGILTQTDRLLATPRAKEAMSEFFAETIELAELGTVTKDTTLYPQFTDGLRAEMAAELRLLFADIALESGASMTELLTTSTSYVGPELGALYGIPASAQGTRVTLPADAQRGGILGRAGFLAIQSHNVTTSPTFRGKFVRTKLMCQEIPPPPPGAATDLQVSEGGTLRDTLEQHATDPACSSCHVVMDPPGFALEHFDPIGQWRDLDNNLPIDATGEIDGVPFDGAVELGRVVSETPEYPLCMAMELYRFANGQVERWEDLGTIEAIGAEYASAGQRFGPLVQAIVVSDAFRLAMAPLGEACDTEDQTRACSTACGDGAEICSDGRWSACTAQAVGVESCNGVDDDCDGIADESLERACDDVFGRGTQTCTAGAWLECSGPAAGDEQCNGVDDDLDGSIDEDLAVLVTTMTYTDLATLGHYSCDAAVDPFSPACHAAAHRACGGNGCSVSGFGPVGLTAVDLSIACLDDTQATVIGTSFTELSGYHYGCNINERQGGACNAAISRMCGALGLNTGYGPVENSGDAATIVCTPAATVYNGSYTTLSGFDGGCNATSGRTGAACNHAMHEWCRSIGHATGHGPLENSGDLAVVACLGVL